MERKETDLPSRTQDEQILMRCGESSFIRKLHIQERGLHVLMSRFEAMEARFVLCLDGEDQDVSIAFLPSGVMFNCGWRILG